MLDIEWIGNPGISTANPITNPNTKQDKYSFSIKGWSLLLFKKKVITKDIAIPTMSKVGNSIFSNVVLSFFLTSFIKEAMIRPKLAIPNNKNVANGNLSSR